MSSPESMPDPGERDPRDDQRAWEEIVRRLRSELPVTADDDARTHRSAPAGSRGPRDHELAEDPEDEDWVPADPGRVTDGLAPSTLAAWAVLIAVPVACTVLGYLLGGLPWWLWIPGLALLLGAVVTLLRGLPSDEDRDELDDGARV